MHQFTRLVFQRGCDILLLTSMAVTPDSFLNENVSVSTEWRIVTDKILGQFTATERRLANVKWNKVVRKRIPIVDWLPQYNFGKFLQDILAGFSVGLTEIPQGIAYAVVAGLEPQYGLYSGFMGCFVYAVLGSCKDVNIGPTAIMALMIQPYVTKLGVQASILMTFLTGCIIFLLGVFQLGFIVDFFSYPIIAGFTSAAALQIASSQVKSLLGIPGKANEFLESWINVIENIKETRLWDTVLGVICILILLGMRELKRFGGIRSNPEWSTSRKVIGKIAWLLSLARNALIVVVTTLMAFLFAQNGEEPFIITGPLGGGLPDFQFPNFTIEFENVTYSFVDVAKEMGSSIAFIPLICIVESIAIAKAFSKGKTVDATQEMLAVGVSNFLGSFVGSMPVTGSFTRTAVNNASGVKTTMGGVLTGIMVLMAIAFLTSTFQYIPKATLAGVIICAMIYLFEYEAIPLLWRTKKLDLIPFLVTLLACLFISLEYGILIGIGVNLLFILYSSARPPVHLERKKLPEGDLLLVTPNREIQFPAAEFIREKVMKECNYPGTSVVIDGRYVTYIDATVAKNLLTLAEDLKLRDQNIILWNFRENVKEVCVGLHSNTRQYFREGKLEELVDNPALDRRTNPDVVFAIQ